MHEDRDTLIEHSKLIISDCSIRVYRSFAQFLLAVFNAVFLHKFSCGTARQRVIFKAIIPEDHPIIPELFVILFTTYYSKNYSGIMYACQHGGQLGQLLGPHLSRGPKCGPLLHYQEIGIL